MKYLVGFCLCVVSVACAEATDNFRNVLIGDDLSVPGTSGETIETEGHAQPERLRKHKRLTVAKLQLLELKNRILNHLAETSESKGKTLTSINIDDLQRMLSDGAIGGQPLSLAETRMLEELVLGMQSAVIGNEKSTGGTKDDSEAARGDAEESNEIEWRPRLQIMLFGSGLELQTIEEPYVRSPAVSGRRGNLDIQVRSRRVAAIPVHPSETATLYCDAVSINVLNDRDAPRYTLECADKIHIRINGLCVDAESAKFKDGKCELVAAIIGHKGTKATTEKITLSLPVHSFLTSTFGKPIPPAECTDEGSGRTRTEDGSRGPEGGFFNHSLQWSEGESVSSSPFAVKPDQYWRYRDDL